MKSIAEIEDEIVEEFSLFEGDREGMMDYIIDIGKKVPAISPDHMTDDFLVKGCQSKVWLHAFEKDGRIFYEADSNTVITKGIIALLIRVLSDQTAKDIIGSDLSFIDRIQLRSLLTSQRSNGLTAMLGKMKAYATLYT